MRLHPVLVAPLLVSVSALAGCSAAAAPSPTSSSAAPATTSARTPATSSASTSKPAPKPVPASAAMVCSPEIGGSLKSLLNLTQIPTGTSTWDGTVFTCAYALAGGPLVLTVRQSPSPAAARTQLSTLQARAAQTQRISGLASFGLPAFQSAQGLVGFAKDNFTLVVDASKLPAKVGPYQRERADFAYSVASDVLACWREHGTGG